MKNLENVINSGLKNLENVISHVMKNLENVIFRFADNPNLMVSYNRSAADGRFFG